MAEARDGPEVASIPTTPGRVPAARLRRGRAGRRLFFIALCVLLVAAIAGRLGVRTGEVRAEGNGYELTVRYPSLTRPGLAATWEVEVRRRGGFSRVVTLAVDSSYLAIFDEHGLDPDPVGATTDRERVIWSFEPPQDADTMTVSFDARIEPAVQVQPTSGAVAALEEGRVMTSVRFETLVLP